MWLHRLSYTSPFLYINSQVKFKDKTSILLFRSGSKTIPEFLTDNLNKLSCLIKLNHSWPNSYSTAASKSNRSQTLNIRHVKMKTPFLQLIMMITLITTKEIKKLRKRWANQADGQQRRSKSSSKVSTIKLPPIYFAGRPQTFRQRLEKNREIYWYKIWYIN